VTRRLASAIVVAALVAACRGKSEPEAARPDAAPVPAPDGRTLAAENCMMCHAEEMLRQQHLTSAQWAAVVKKMTTWGAPIEPENTDTLVAYLAATYGPDAGPFEPAAMSPEAALAQLAPTDDGPFAGGDATRGGAMFASICSACHGANARGQIGPSLVDRPILRRAGEVAAMVRTGRGRMPPMPGTADGQIADVLAYLRGLRGT
jgi:mono/diheme cytochrome c family protein